MLSVLAPAVIEASAGTLHVYPVAPLTGDMLKITPAALLQSEAGPVIVPAAPAPFVIETDKLDAAPLPHVLVGVTDTDPALVAKSTLMLVLPCPPVIVAPAGTVQV
jgi:hypothetical protein